MKVFKDSEKREWKLVVNTSTAKVVRDLTTVNLFDLFADEAKRVFGDPCLLVNVLYALCRTQCEERKLSDEDFGAALVGDAIEDAADALMDEVADFFPSSRRAILRKTMDKAKQVAERMTARAMEALEKVDVESLMPPTKSPGSSA